MEDSAKRRARLQAMRMEASSASTEAPSPSLSTANTPLSNPLAHSSVPSQQSSLSPHRFDYYTDPAAAYSSVKRKTNDGGGGDVGHGGHSHPPKFSSPIRNISPVTCTAAQSIGGQQMEKSSSIDISTYSSHTLQVPSPNQSFNGTPFFRPHTVSLRSPVQYPSLGSLDRGSHAPQGPPPNQNFYNAPFPRFQSGSLRSPVQYLSPASGDRGAHTHQAPSPSQSFYNTPFPRSQTCPSRSPVQYPSPASGDRGAHRNFPRPWNMSGNSSEYNFTPNSSNAGSPSSAYSSIRGSPHSHSSGRGWQFSGRGGYHNQYHGLGRRVDKFASKSMVKDPWRKLKPIVGCILVPLSEPMSWLPASITANKAKVSEASTATKSKQNLTPTSTDAKPKLNLAEILALAFEESVSNDQEGEGSIKLSSNGRD